MDKRENFIGWRVVTVCGLLYSLLGAYGLSAAQIAIPLMAQDPAVTMNRSMIGLGFTVFILCQGLPGPFIGQLVAKKGAKFTYAVGAVIVAVSAVFLAFFIGTSTVAYLIGFGVINSLGSTVAGQIPTQTTVSYWFLHKRGMAMSISMAIGGILGFAFPLITNYSIEFSGKWETAWYTVAILAAVGLVLAIAGVVNKPADVGQTIDGGAAAAGQSARVSKVYRAATHKTSGEALRTPAFWLILLPCFTVFCGLNLAVSSGVLHFTAAGLTSGFIAGALSAQAIGSALIRLGIAPLADRIEPVHICGASAILIAIGALLAANNGMGAGWIAYAYYILLGVGFGANIVFMPTAFANYFGVTHFPKIMGTVLPLLSIFSGLVPTVAGAVFDASGSYNLMFYVIAVLAALGFIASLLVRFPKDEKHGA